MKILYILGLECKCYTFLPWCFIWEWHV